MTTNLDSNPTAQPSTRRNLVVGILLGTVVSVLLLLPGTLNAISGSNILPSVAEAGPVVVAGIAALALLYTAFTELVPALRARSIHPSAGRPNLQPLTATPRRALLVGAIAGLVFGLAATQGVGAAADAAHPGAETAPGKQTESGAVPHTGLPTGLVVTGAPATL